MQITYSCFARRPLTLGLNPLVQILAGEQERSLLIWIVLCEPFPRGLNNASVQVVDKSRAVQLRPTRLYGDRETSDVSRLDFRTEFRTARDDVLRRGTRTGANARRTGCNCPRQRREKFARRACRLGDAANPGFHVRQQSAVSTCVLRTDNEQVQQASRNFGHFKRERVHGGNRLFV